jgi:rare lipoprotein A
MKFFVLILSSVLVTVLASCGTVPSSAKDPIELSPPILSTEQGIASWYSVKTNHGTKTASGRRLNDNAYTAAHKTLPFGSQVRVTNLSNGRSEKLTITDRGPFIKGRVIDVTIGSSKRLGFYSNGITKVKVQLIHRGDWKYQRH